VKFSDWIPFAQNKNTLRFAEDYYETYGLPHGYNVPEIKESMYYLYMSLDAKFRHPRNALAHIDTPEQYHKYRLLFQMHTYLLLMRMNLRLGSLYDKRHLYFHDLDFADDLEISFLIAKTYYTESRKYWEKAKELAIRADEYPFEIDLGTMESERYEIVNGTLDFDRIIDLHTARVEAKLEHITAFLDSEGRPRPVKTAMQKDLEKMYDGSFTPDPLGNPELKPLWNEKPLYPDNDEFFKIPGFSD
jgi:hypothetical protein